jgi:ABC-type multidrug transport system fused ATPase/permease subunit
MKFLEITSIDASDSPEAGSGSAVTRRPLGFIGLLTLAPWPLGLAIATAIASATLAIAPFWFIYRIVAELLAATPDMAEVWPLVWWVLGLLALRWALMAASHVLAHTGAFSIQHRLRLAMARRLGAVPLSFFAGRGSGSLRRTLTDDVNALEGFFAHMLPDVVAAATAPLAALALLFAADWRLALAALAPLPLAVLAQWWFMRRGVQKMREWSALQKRIADEVGEFVRGVHVVKSFGLDARRFGQLAAAVRGAVDWVADYAQSSSRGWVLFVGVLTANLVVVARLYEFESGSLRVGGGDVRQWPLDALLGKLGIVFQDVQLFHGTVRENLKLARPDASNEAIEAAARAAQAHDFVMALPQGYDTPLGERGERLSGGERQRLSIARALLKGAPILLLDEATASVDAESEALIQEALTGLCRGRTVLMIAHRLRTVMHADHIVVMDGGRVAGQGQHDELLRSCTVYQRLWQDHEQARDWSLGSRDTMQAMPGARS